MENSLLKDILRVCEILKKHEVDYLIVGGTALAFYGHFRMSRMPNGLPSEKHDFDFWFYPGYQNYYNLLNALEELGIDVSKFRNEKTPTPKKSFFTHEFDNFKIDFLPEILGLDGFYKSFANKTISKIGETEIHVLSKDDLIKSKQATSREKDIEDLNELGFLFPDDDDQS